MMIVAIAMARLENLAGCFLAGPFRVNKAEIVLSARIHEDRIDDLNHQKLSYGLGVVPDVIVME